LEVFKKEKREREAREKQSKLDEDARLERERKQRNVEHAQQRKRKAGNAKRENQRLRQARGSVVSVQGDEVDARHAPAAAAPRGRGAPLQPHLAVTRRGDEYYHDESSDDDYPPRY
jgi:hypothetical protein